jgi:iron complex outermembrane receptor protein
MITPALTQVISTQLPPFNFIYYPSPPYPAADAYTARVKFQGVTDTQIFNQDTNLEARFATGFVSHRVLGGVDYMNFQGQSGERSALNLTPINVYDPDYGQPESLIATPCDVYAPGPVTIAPLCNSDQSVAQTGLYVQDQMRLGNWIAVLGARKDWIENETTSDASGRASQKDDAMSYRAGLMYEFASGFTPYASYGESFVPVVDTDINGNPFDPQKGRMYELGFKYQPTGANFAINSAIYDIAESNRLEYFPGYTVQTGAVAIKGFEIELTGKITKHLKVAGGYSYTDAQYDGEENVGNQLESIPKHLASMWGVWEFDQPYLKGWSVGAGIRYIGESWDSTNTIEVPDVTLFDAMVAYEEKDWRWSINAKNLENKEYVTTCLSRGDCFLGTARTITTGLTYKF